LVTVPLFAVGLPLSMTCRAIPYGVGLPEWDRQQPFANTVERPGYRRACRYDVRDPDGIPPEAYPTPQKAGELRDCIALGPKPLSHHAGSIRRASNPRPETQPPLTSAMIRALTEGVSRCQLATNSRRSASTRPIPDPPADIFPRVIPKSKSASHGTLMQFPPTVPPRLSWPAFLRCSTGGRPNTDYSLAFGTARVGLIGLISRRRRIASGSTGIRRRSLSPEPRTRSAAEES